jgi:hypothetical protein
MPADTLLSLLAWIELNASSVSSLSLALDPHSLLLGVSFLQVEMNK